MKVMRFRTDRVVDLDDADLELGVLNLARDEAYLADPDAVGELIERPLFGFLRPRRRKLMTARRGDGAPLNLVDPEKQKQADLQDLQSVEDAAFKLTEMQEEQRQGPANTFAVKGLTLVLLGEMALVAVLAIGKFGPDAIERWKMAFGGGA